MKFRFIYIIIIFLFSCESDDKIKTQSTYYVSRNLKQKKFYDINSNRLDSSKIYFDSTKRILKIKDVSINDSVLKSTFFYENGSIEAEGFYKNGLKFNNWHFYRNDGTLSQKIEYKIVNGEQYLNQRMRFDVNGVPIYEGSHFYDYETSNDTIQINEDVKFLFHLKNPFFSPKSDVYILKPKLNYEFNNDFSNLNEIELDTIYSLVKTHDMKNQNLSVAFALNFSKPGNKIVKGILVEEIDKDRMEMDSLDILQTRYYFDKALYVLPIDTND